MRPNLFGIGARRSAALEVNAAVPPRRGIERELGLLCDALSHQDQAEMLDTDIGPVLVHARDEVMTPWIREHGIWEPDESAFFRSTLRPGDVLVDCGANFGWFSLLGSSLVGSNGKVIAIEPEQANLALLRANLWLAQANNVTVVPCAAGARRGLLELRFNVANRGDHQVHRFESRPVDLAGSSRLVPVIALDEILDGQPVNMIKIDVQGFDHEVLAGLSATVSANPEVVVLIEYWLTGMAERGVDPQEVLNQYRAAGFDLAVLQPDGTPRRCTDTAIFEAVEASGIEYVNLVLRKQAWT